MAGLSRHFLSYTVKVLLKGGGAIVESNEMRISRLLEKANSLPLCPGVYIMKNSADKIIYVGKSRKLKNRVSQYFQNGEKNFKTHKMVSRVHDFDYIVCDTEIEALTLENTLIKQHSPKYNIKLKDAKSYPYIKVTNEEYPRIVFTRTRANDKAKYYGPYAGTSTVFSVLSIIHRVIGIPSCSRSFPRDIGKGRPCIYKQMNQCCGVCTGEVSREEYSELVRAAQDILKGNTAKVRRDLEEKMMEYAEREQFEAAIRCRNTISALEKLSQKQKVVGSHGEDHDVVGVFSNDILMGISLLNIRDGVLINKYSGVFGEDKIFDDSSVVSFLCDYYRGKEDIPCEILLSFDLDVEEKELLSEFLSGLAGSRVEIKTPERGDKRALAVVAVNNAEQAVVQYEAETERSESVLVDLAEILGLEVVPERIELYDISNLGSEHKTAGMIVCENGRLKHSDYRSFSIKSVENTDDYACMQETIRRRFSHVGDSDSTFAILPDLVLLDGGRGHVRCVKEIMAELGLDIPVFGMVKDDFHKTRAICDDEREISIARNNKVFVFIYKLQEEVHRFTVSKMTKAKRKTLRTSSLEKIQGIGPKKAKLIMLKFGTLENVKKASIEDLRLIKGISDADAFNIYKQYHKEED